jgi:predicted DNA-binding protein (MmcQ/YjbR family)
MTPNQLRDFCLALPQAVETFPFDPELSVFRTSGNAKIFAMVDLAGSPLRLSVKCDPEDSISLRAEFADITPGYHLNKKHWITIEFAGRVPDDLVEDLIRGSHDLVRPKIPRARTSPKPMVE